jgi:two-component system, cell cycle response regulator DivK
MAAVRLVLIVDDDADNREVVAWLLRARGYDVVEAHDGAAAVEAATVRQPHAVLMDAAMPGVDGWEASRRLKSMPETRAIPILMVSAFDLPEHEQRAREVGCSHYLRKPFASATLLSALASALG